MGKTYKHNDIYKEKVSHRKTQARKYGATVKIENWDSTKEPRHDFRHTMSSFAKVQREIRVDTTTLIEHLENAKTFKGKAMCRALKEKVALGDNSHADLFSDIVHYIERGLTEFKVLEQSLKERRIAKSKMESQKARIQGKYNNIFKFENGIMVFDYTFKTVEMQAITGLRRLYSKPKGV